MNAIGAMLLVLSRRRWEHDACECLQEKGAEKIPDELR
jgi:hypothetical protein